MLTYFLENEIMKELTRLFLPKSLTHWSPENQNVGERNLPQKMSKYDYDLIWSANVFKFLQMVMCVLNSKKTTKKTATF